MEDIYGKIVHLFNSLQMILAYILTLAMTIATAVLGGWMLKDFILRKKLCTKETEGEILGFKEEVSHGDDGNRISYYYKYKYCVDNKSFKDISNIGESSPIFTIGSKITLRYNPRNHTQHYIVGSSFSVTMIIGGIFFILMGTVCFIFTCMGIYQRLTGLL